MTRCPKLALNWSFSFLLMHVPSICFSLRRRWRASNRLAELVTESQDRQKAIRQDLMEQVCCSDYVLRSVHMPLSTLSSYSV